MASTNSIRAGRAFVELFADDSALVRGLRRAQKRLEAFGAFVRNLGLRIASLGAAIAAPIGIATIKAASDAEETLSRFEQVFADQAKAASAFADQLSKDVGRSKFAIRDALATYQAFFVGLGLSSEEARGLSQTIQKLAIDFASFNNLSDEEAMTRFISALSGSGEVLDRFGVNIRQAALQQELLRMGIDKAWSSVTEQEKVLARLNIIMKTMGDQGAVGDAVRTAGSFSNQMKRLRGQLHDTSVVIGQALLPGATALVAKVAEVVRYVSEWAQQNQTLIATLFKVLLGITAGGVALVVLGVIISSLGTVLGAVATAFTAVGAVIAALVSPIGLVIAAVAALGAYLVYVTEAGGKAIIWLSERFNALKTDALDSLQGIADALAAGDIALATKVLWLTVKMEWTRGINFLEKAWLNFRDFFLRTGHDMFHGLLALTEQVWHGLEVGWIETTAFFARTWQNFVAFFAETWEHIKAGAQKAWNWIKSLFDDSIDLQAENRLVEDQKQQALKRIDDDQQRNLAEREAKRQADRQRAEAVHRGTMAEIGRQNLEKHQKLDAEFNERIAKNEAELAAARSEWRDALNAARQWRQNLSTDADAPAGLEAPDDILNRARTAVEGLGDRLGDEVARIGARGTFNAAALVGLQSGGAADRMASGIEKIERNTRPLRNAEAVAFE